MKNFFFIITSFLLVILLVWALNTGERIADAYRNIKTDYCTLFSKYDEYFSQVNLVCTYEGCDSTWSIDEYSKYFYFKDKFLKLCK